MSTSRRELVYLLTPNFLNINLTQTISDVLAPLKILEKWLKKCQFLKINGLKIILKKDTVTAVISIAEKMKFSIKDLFRKCDQIRRKLQ